MKSFNVICGDFNSQDFTKYDIMPYLVNRWKTLTPKDKEEAKKDITKWVDSHLMYQYWSRCQYEVILSSWPPVKNEEGKKIDIYWQCKMNMPLIVDIFKENIKLK